MARKKVRDTKSVKRQAASRRDKRIRNISQQYKSKPFQHKPIKSILVKGKFSKVGKAPLKRKARKDQTKSRKTPIRKRRTAKNVEADLQLFSPDNSVEPQLPQRRCAVCAQFFIKDNNWQEAKKQFELNKQHIP
ncbi:uncharacterized protein LOC115628740 [Scaptodrosophila lebanonensis]|uniref:Uncharacterized protein LOC115628740 n=1 Tax=Drosophila lebanonensis TaxID=7225 RepID=A0A6J2TXG9_DROLE|nr:uncharacterized protein LOC115628740 [Scaptodrosophila lebanonensis]